jgi:hypothetical protein
MRCDKGLIWGCNDKNIIEISKETYDEVVDFLMKIDRDVKAVMEKVVEIPKPIELPANIPPEWFWDRIAATNLFSRPKTMPSLNKTTVKTINFLNDVVFKGFDYYQKAFEWTEPYKFCEINRVWPTDWESLADFIKWVAPIILKGEVNGLVMRPRTGASLGRFDLGSFFHDDHQKGKHFSPFFRLMTKMVWWQTTTDSEMIILQKNIPGECHPWVLKWINMWKSIGQCSDANSVKYLWKKADISYRWWLANKDRLIEYAETTDTPKKLFKTNCNTAEGYFRMLWTRGESLYRKWGFEQFPHPNTKSDKWQMFARMCREQHDIELDG